MLGEIRLGFFVDGIGFYRDCSELIYKIDSNSNLKVFKEGEIVEIDESLFKIESIELAFIPYPGRKNFERQKPIKLVYVSKASALTGETKIRSAVKLKDLETIEELKVKEKDIEVDKGYNKEEFKEEFSHVIKHEKPKRGRTEKNAAPSKRKQTRKAKTEKKEPSKPKATKEPKTAKLERKTRSTKGNKDSKIKPDKVTKKPTKARAKVKEKSKAEDSPSGSKKQSRRKRCPSCKELFKSLGRHKCKTK